MQTTQQVRDLTNEYTADWPDTIEVDFSSDISDFIFEMIGSLETSISNAIILVMILVIAALGLRLRFAGRPVHSDLFLSAF